MDHPISLPKTASSFISFMELVWGDTRTPLPNGDFEWNLLNPALYHQYSNAINTAYLCGAYPRWAGKPIGRVFQFPDGSRATIASGMCKEVKRRTDLPATSH